MNNAITRREALAGLAAAAQVALLSPARAQARLTATEIGRWPVPEANQAAAVDANHFYGIGNRALVKLRKDTGDRVAEWASPKDGPITHFNFGFVEGHRLTLSHSNFPQLPPASSLEIHDTRTLQLIESVSLGVRSGSLTWAVRHRGKWWACFAYYNDQGTMPGHDQRSTYVGEFDDRWQMLRSWLFPEAFIRTWGRSSSSGGDFGEEGLLYCSGHDAPELHVLRLPRSGGSTLEHVGVIEVPFEGQGWAWDRSARGQRVIYGISREKKEIIAARIPKVDA